MSLITFKDYNTSLVVPKSSKFSRYIACMQLHSHSIAYVVLMLHLTAQALTHQGVRNHEDVATQSEDGFMLQRKKNPLGKKKKQIHNNRWWAYHLIQWGFFSIAEKAAYFFHKIVIFNLMLSAHSISSVMDSKMGNWLCKHARPERESKNVFFNHDLLRSKVWRKFVCKARKNSNLP